MRFAPPLLGLCLAFELLACGDNSTTTTTIARPELIAVDPNDFLGQVPCADAPNAAQSYVATLFDVTPTATGDVPDPGFPLPSSPATSCLKPVMFSFVLSGHRYLAQIDAYDRPPDQLRPLAEGARSQLDSELTRVAPRWTTTCGGYPLSPEAGPDSGMAWASGAEENLPGVLSYTGLTQTPHDCRAGLLPVSN